MPFEPTSQFLQERLWLSMCEAIRYLVPRHYTKSAIAGKYIGYDDSVSKERWLNNFAKSDRRCPSLRTLDVVFAKELLRLLKDVNDEQSIARHSELSKALEAYVLSDHGINNRHFLRIPHLHEEDYRFRHPTRAFELRPFITFSDNEPDITEGRGGLKGQQRKQLYESWFEGGAGRHRFMLLEKANEQTGCWDCVAVSIVLGLTAEIADKFAEGTYETVRQIGVEFISDFDGRMTGRGEAAECVLVDTFIVKRMPCKQIRRTNHQGWGTALLFRHIAVMAGRQDEVRILVEPDERRLETLCHVFAFSTNEKGLWTKQCAKSDVNDRFSSTMWENVERLRSRFPHIEGEG